jgi:hypothetical protein
VRRREAGEPTGPSRAPGLLSPATAMVFTIRGPAASIAIAGAGADSIDYND